MGETNEERMKAQCCLYNTTYENQDVHDFGFRFLFYRHLVRSCYSCCLVVSSHVVRPTLPLTRNTPLIIGPPAPDLEKSPVGKAMRGYRADTKHGVDTQGDRVQTS